MYKFVFFGITRIKIPMNNFLQENTPIFWHFKLLCLPGIYLLKSPEVNFLRRKKAAVLTF
jgi:hypothetical protein